MRRMLVALLVLAVHARPDARALQTPAATDGLAALLRGLEHALATGRVEDLRAIAASSITAASISQFTVVAGDPAARDRAVVVKERLRRPAAAGGYDVVADLLVSRGAGGRAATWVVGAVPDASASGEGGFRIAALREVSAIDGLVRLDVDASRQYTISNLTIGAPDLSLTVSTGVAFAVQAPGGTTGLVVRGRGRLRFTPPDPAEQLQLRIFSYRSDFVTDIDALFVRMNAREFEERVATNALVPAAVTPGDLERARALFDEYAPRTYSLDLKALTPDRWSLEPAPGSLVFEFHTSRHGWLTYARSPAEPEDIALFDRASARTICSYRSAARVASRGRAYGDEDVAGYDVEHYALDLAFDPARSRISGQGSLSLLVTDAAASTVTIRLAPALTVSRVWSPQLGELIALRVIGQNHLLVGLPAQVHRGSRFTIDVSYAGVLPPQPTDQESLAPQGQPPVQEDRLIVTPEPRFLYSNRAPWYPQGLATDYATAELRITVPAEYDVAASGRLVGSSGPSASAGGTRTLQYVADRPIRYLACLISRLQRVGRTVVDVPRVASAEDEVLEPPTTVVLDVRATSRMVARNRATTARAAAMLKYFADTIGEAPYPALDLAILDDNLPGGHSPAYVVSLHQALPTTPYAWSDDPVAFDHLYPNFFLAHELAHQWWGQAVGWRNYHDQWLSEGLSQYFAALVAAQDRGPALLTSLISTMRASSEKAVAQGPIALGYRIGHIRGDGRALRHVLYNKSAVVLHMLRRYIGDEAFFAGLRRFYAGWRFRKAGTDDLQAAFEASASRPLDTFFDKWIRGFTMPRIRVSWRSEHGGTTGVVRVEQKGEAFDFPLTVVLQLENGRSIERTLAVTGAAYEEPVPIPSPIRRVVVRDSLSYFDLAR